MSGKGGAQRLAGAFALAYPLGNDVLCALKGFLYIVYALFLVNISSGSLRYVSCLLRLQYVGQRFQSGLASHLCSGATFLLEWQIDVFQRDGVCTSLNALAQFVCQFALPFYGLQDIRTPFVRLLQLLQLPANLCHFHIGHAAGRFLSVAADEGDGGTFQQQCNGVLHIYYLQAGALGYDLFVCHVRAFMRSRLMEMICATRLTKGMFMRHSPGLSMTRLNCSNS